jgi:NTE family protein
VLTLSGGGFRATLAGLGAARLLADAGMLSSLRYLSSVSGGSIANGLIAEAWSQLRAAGYTAQAFDDLVIDPLIERISTRSLKMSLVRGLWRVIGPRTRTDLLARRLDEWFFDGLVLEDLDPEVRWIVNAANLTTGVRFGFERDVLGDYVIGLASTSGTGILLARAIAASAAVPGVFPPLPLTHPSFPCGIEPPQLVDGGAYDNTGLEAVDSESYRQCFFVSFNAGGLLRPGRYGSIPFVRELARANSLLYRQSTALRTRTIVERFERGRMAGPGDPVPQGARKGVLVGLATDMPVAGSAQLDTWRSVHPEQATLDGRHLAVVPTAFDKFDRRLCRSLVHRGWWLVGAALAKYHPDRIPDPGSLTPPKR